MQHRPSSSRRLLPGALLLAAAALSSCGFDYATDRIYTPANGANERSGEVDVLGAVIVSAEEGSGVFVASFTNSFLDEAVTLEGLTSTDAEALSAPEVPPIEIQPDQLVNLADTETPVEVTGTLEAGTWVPVEISFSNGQTTKLTVQVVNNCGYFHDVAGLPAGEEECEVAEPVEHAEGE